MEDDDQADDEVVGQTYHYHRSSAPQMGSEKPEEPALQADGAFPLAPAPGLDDPLYQGRKGIKGDKEALIEEIGDVPLAWPFANVLLLWIWPWLANRLLQASSDLSWGIARSNPIFAQLEVPRRPAARRDPVIRPDASPKLVREQPCWCRVIPTTFLIWQVLQICCARLLIAGLCGAIIGIERKDADRPAGLRSLTLVSSGAALYVLSSTYGFGHRGDPARAAAQVCTGCGFIGAGVIARGSARDPVRGVTTACAVWVSAALGVCSATGMPMFALYATGVTVSILRVSRWYNAIIRSRFAQVLQLNLPELH